MHTSRSRRARSRWVMKPARVFGYYRIRSGESLRMNWRLLRLLWPWRPPNESTSRERAEACPARTHSFGRGRGDGPIS